MTGFSSLFPHLPLILPLVYFLLLFYLLFARLQISELALDPFPTKKKKKKKKTRLCGFGLPFLLFWLFFLFFSSSPNEIKHKEDDTLCTEDVTRKMKGLARRRGLN